MLNTRLQHLLSLVLLCSSLVSGVYAAPTFAAVPAPPKLNVGSYILIDFDSGSILADYNSDERAEPASLTKIMTSYVAADALASNVIKLSDVTTVSEKAWRMEGSRMFIEVNKQVSVDELLQGIIIQSGNDASVAMAEFVSGSEEVFASVMNQHAGRLGLMSTSFANSTGLPDPGTYTTARDLSVLAAVFIRDYPDIYQRFAEKNYTYAGITQRNRNRLLTRDASADGFKTGHTEAAGYCLVSSARRDGMRLIAVVMGAESDSARTEASQTLLNYGFRFFESRKIYAVGDVVTTAKVWKGVANEVNVGVGEELHIVIPRGKYGEVKASAEITESVVAPFDSGQPLGSVVLMLGGREVASVPLVANRGIAQASLFSRAVDEVMMRLE
jgi:D-alanyl-D-alanine carboxypeptidase (penicillin-binding protein 5/6)